MVLLHGLGGSAAVWDGFKAMLAEWWPGRWLAIDFRGHGRSFHQGPYGIGIHAADVAALLSAEEEVTLVGHSMGGAVGLALASGLFGVSVRQVFAFSVKVDWSEDDVVRARAVASAPAKVFATRAEAIERYLRVTGLKGLVAPEAPAAAIGVTETEGGFRLAADPRSNDVGKPDLPALSAMAAVPLCLMCGEKDAIARPDRVRSLGGEVVVLPRLGHNPHVEAPRVLRDTIKSHLAS